MKDLNISLIQTSSNKKAVLKKIAKALLSERLSCCVHLSNAITSYYTWNDTLQEDEEYLLQAKIKTDTFNQCSELIKTLHNYDTPEIILLHITHIEPDYLAWARSELA